MNYSIITSHLAPGQHGPSSLGKRQFFAISAYRGWPSPACRLCLLSALFCEFIVAPMLRRSQRLSTIGARWAVQRHDVTVKGIYTVIVRARPGLAYHFPVAS